jgi:hypothetical protein
MALPVLTPEQRAEMQEKRRISAARVAEVKTYINNRTVPFDELFNMAEREKPVARMRVEPALRALPGVGPAKAKSMMEEIGIPENRRLAGLGSKQKIALVEAINAHHSKMDERAAAKSHG